MSNNKSNNTARFNPDDPSPRVTRASTTIQNPGIAPNGIANPGTPNPFGSYDPATGRFTGDFKGLGVTKPWGGKKNRKSKKNSRRNNRISKKRSNKSVHRR